MSTPRGSVLARGIALTVLCITVGCAHEPFARGPLEVLVNPDAPAMRDSFAQTIPPQFITDDTVIIHAPFHDLAVLGVVRIDRNAGKFDLVGLNQLGVQLFAVGGDQKNSVVRFAIPPLDEHRDLLLSVADDVRRMYFDLLPSPAARVDARRTFVRFSERNDQGTLLFEMGRENFTFPTDQAERPHHNEKPLTPALSRSTGRGGNESDLAPSILLEKRQAGFFGTIWRVQYFNYVAVAGGLYPRGIVLDNSRFFYRIVVKNRDWQASVAGGADPGPASPTPATAEATQ